jgi:hypothetical protein
MSWEDIEGKLKKSLTLMLSFPAGTMWLPISHLTIDDWLTSIAETDEELRELDIPRIRFLRNRWPIVTLVELEWDDEFSNRRRILGMYVGRSAYILFSDWKEYQVIAAIEPSDNPSLYRTVIGKLLENRSFVATRPTHIRIHRPDLVGEFVTFSHEDAVSKKTGGPDLKPDERWRNFLSHILVGWIGKWLSMPQVGFWHEDTPEPVSGTEKAEIVIKKVA